MPTESGVVTHPWRQDTLTQSGRSVAAGATTVAARVTHERRTPPTARCDEAIPFASTVAELLALTESMLTYLAGVLTNALAIRRYRRIDARCCKMVVKPRRTCSTFRSRLLHEVRAMPLATATASVRPATMCPPETSTVSCARSPANRATHRPPSRCPWLPRGPSGSRGRSGTFARPGTPRRRLGPSSEADRV